jgi:hypothetical protein
MVRQERLQRTPFPPPGGPPSPTRSQIPRAAAERLTGQHLRVMISHDDHLLLVGQIDADNRVLHRHQSPQPSQPARCGCDHPAAHHYRCLRTSSSCDGTPSPKRIRRTFLHPAPTRRTSFYAAVCARSDPDRQLRTDEALDRHRPAVRDAMAQVISLRSRYAPSNNVRDARRIDNHDLHLTPLHIWRSLAQRTVASATECADIPAVSMGHLVAARRGSAGFQQDGIGAPVGACLARCRGGAWRRGGTGLWP